MCFYLTTKNIVTDGNSISYTQWFEKVIVSIQEILDDTEKLLSFNGFHQKKVWP